MLVSRRALGALSLAAMAAFALAACGGGGGSAGGEADDDLSDLVLIDVNVGGSDGVALNQIIMFEFSEEVVGSSVTPETVRIRLSPANAKQVPGSFNISGSVIEFFPRLPVQPDLSDSGLLPGSTYEIKLPGAPKPNTLENADGDPLADTYKVSFATAVASSPDVFIDYNPDQDPQVVSVNPKPDALDVPQAIDVELTFSEPLHPATVTTSNVTLTMTHRPPGNPLDPQRPIQGHLVLEQNRQSVVVTFVPDFPLADNATYLLNVDRRVQDLVGNDSIEFTSEFTIRDEPPVPGSFTLDFGDGTEIYEDVDETIASWNEDVPGALAGIFTAGAGDGSDGDFAPVFNTTLNGNSQTGGVFNFRTFKIPAGVTVRVTGDAPVTILSLATARIEGTLDASGFKGANSESNSSSWQIPTTRGGAGGPGGGDGGDVATVVVSSSSAGGSSWKGPDGGDGEDGYGTTGTAGEGGLWGNSSYPTYYYKMGAGGGGGGHRTAGEDGHDTAYTYPYYGQRGGDGGGTGGNAQLSPITAGGGAGAGVNGYYYYYPWNTGASAGGGGGGALTFACANNIEVIGGEILARGGDGGTVANTATYGGGSGGGGAGGAIFLRSLRQLIATNAVISTAGGKAGTGGSSYYTGLGGDGGDGWIRLEDGDGSPSLSQTTVEPSGPASGTFVASGPGAPSVGQTLWMNIGVFDPVFLEPTEDDLAVMIPKAGQTIKVEVQATMEDLFDLGQPDPDMASPWVELANIQTLNGNGYSFMRLRVTFTLASDQEIDDPLPFVDLIRIRYLY